MRGESGASGGPLGETGEWILSRELQRRPAPLCPAAPVSVCAASQMSPSLLSVGEESRDWMGPGGLSDPLLMSDMFPMSASKRVSD